MYYGIYKNISHGAWKCLVDFNITSLPVDVLKIARSAGIRVIKNSSVYDLMPGEHGKSYFNGYCWTIIYNDEDPVEICRFTIAHELGHFFLGHDLTYSRFNNVRKFGCKPTEEQQADSFAIRLLAPACILNDLRVSSYGDIEKYCRIPSSVAKKRYERMKLLYKRDSFFTDPIEEQVYHNFSKYLYLAKRKIK